MAAFTQRHVFSRSRRALAIFAAFGVVIYWVLLHYAESGYTIATWNRVDPTLMDGGRYNEKTMHDQFEHDYAVAGNRSGAAALFGNTLATLDNTPARKMVFEAALTQAEKMAHIDSNHPYVYNPYPKHSEVESATGGRAKPVTCDGPRGQPLPDVMAFKGTLRNFPKPGFGSYDVLDIDENLCFERETRLGIYGYTDNTTDSEAADTWDQVRWGQLQEDCIGKNQARFDEDGVQNPYVDVKYGSWSKKKHGNGGQLAGRASNRRRTTSPKQETKTADKEERTAILLRTFTGKVYTENDKQVIRSLVSELSLRTGGQYQVFLLVQVKDDALNIWENPNTYQWALNQSVPEEFRDMTVLWNDEVINSEYAVLDRKLTTVHVSQWLSVQRFSKEFPHFDYIWNWELDSRLIGHNYDFLEKLAVFAKKQPRRGLWERNERYYIPSIHGDYDTEFRESVEALTSHNAVWGAPELPFVSPVGPKPPVQKPQDDNYEWGVGEEADLITLAPIFDPVDSSWIGRGDVWGYKDASHKADSLPRRTTIITQSRVSKRLLDIMHVENLRGNHVSSEMITQTVALLHGLKAVYAPMPIFFDRPWSGERLARWFNGGLRGESGGKGSAMGWGREGRFQGSTWYFRANPPQRLYLNWMGWEDTGIGGPEWEEVHGRTCLPPMLLHPVKNVAETEPGHTSESNLPYR